jgi:hypothetical protein
MTTENAVTSPSNPPLRTDDLPVGFRALSDSAVPASGPNFLQDRREAVASASNFGSDLGGSPSVVGSKITSLSAPARWINMKSEFVVRFPSDRHGFVGPFSSPATDEGTRFPSRRRIPYDCPRERARRSHVGGGHGVLHCNRVPVRMQIGAVESD